MGKATYTCACGRAFIKSTEAAVTGYRLEGYGPGHECCGCPFVVELKTWKNIEAGAVVIGHECRASRHRVTYVTTGSFTLEDDTTVHVYTLDMTWLARFIGSYLALDGRMVQREPDAADFPALERYFRSASLNWGRRVYAFAFKPNKAGRRDKKRLLEEYFGADKVARASLGEASDWERVLGQIDAAKRAARQEGADDRDMAPHEEEFTNCSNPAPVRDLSVPGPEVPAEAGLVPQAEGVDRPPARPLADITAEICFFKAETAQCVIEIGRRLIEAKEQLEHGQWYKWLKEEVEFSFSTAERYMQIAREFSNPALVRDLGYTKILALLAVPAEERDEFIAATHEIAGEEKTVAEMTRRELEQAIRERDAAREECENIRTGADMRDRIARQRLDVALKATDEATAAKTERDALRRQLKELSERPVEVAVREPSEEELEGLRNQLRNELIATMPRRSEPISVAEAADIFARIVEGGIASLSAAAGGDPEVGIALLDAAIRCMEEQLRGLYREKSILQTVRRARDPDADDVDF